MARSHANRRRREDDNEARLDELGNDPRQVGTDSAGQSGDPQRLSIVPDATNESVASWRIPIRV